MLPDDASKLLDPGVVLDASGRPHAVFTRGFVNTLPVGLIHEWWDGSQWDAEPIATDTLQPWGPWDPPKRPCFGIAPDGGVHVVYRRPATFPQEALVHVLRTGDDAVETVVTTASVPDLRRDAFAFGVGADGTAYVAELGFSDSLGAEAVVLSTRSPAGAWTDSLVPSGAVRYGFVGIVPGSAGEVAIAFTRDDGVYAIRRMGGVWESPQLASSFTGDHTSFAGSPDLASLSLTVSADGQARVAVLGSSGWQDVQVGTTGWSGWAGVGRTGAWALFRHDSASSSGILPYSLFDEVP